jgi:uncharacterized protein YfdQ (DUF2303 family)
VTVTEVSDEHGLKQLPPAYIKQTIALQSGESLANYVNRHHTDTTVLFADISNARIVAALDWHGAQQASHVAHRATLTLQASPEWELWTGIDNKMMSQMEFARFLEENKQDVVMPEVARLLEVCRDLQANRNIEVKKVVRAGSNNESVYFSDTATAKTGDGLEIPTELRLDITVFFGERPVELNASLRWGLADNKLQLGVKLQRAKQVRTYAFQSIVERVSTAAICPAMYGTIGASADHCGF